MPYCRSDHLSCLDDRYNKTPQIRKLKFIIHQSADPGAITTCICLISSNPLFYILRNIKAFY